MTTTETTITHEEPIVTTSVTIDPVQDATPATEQAPVPSATQEDAAKTLKAFGNVCAKLTDGNYNLAPLAYQFIDEYLACSPGKHTGAAARSRLVGEWLQHDTDTFSMTESQAKRTIAKKVNMLVNCHAVCMLIGDGRGVAKGDGTKAGKGKGSKDGRLPWGTLREFAPLVVRGDSDIAETWTIIPGVADEARALLAEVASSGMARADVVRAVLALRLKSAESIHTNAVSSGDDVARLAAEQAILALDAKLNPPAATEEKPEPTKDDGKDDSDDDKPTSRAPKTEKVKAPDAEQMAAMTPNAVAEQLYAVIANHTAPGNVIARLLGLIAESPANVAERIGTPIMTAVKTVLS